MKLVVNDGEEELIPYRILGTELNEVMYHELATYVDLTQLNTIGVQQEGPTTRDNSIL